jgi:hypothetical protein
MPRLEGHIKLRCHRALRWFRLAPCGKQLLAFLLINAIGVFLFSVFKLLFFHLFQA